MKMLYVLKCFTLITLQYSTYNLLIQVNSFMQYQKLTFIKQNKDWSHLIEKKMNDIFLRTFYKM